MYTPEQIRRAAQRMTEASFRLEEAIVTEEDEDNGWYCTCCCCTGSCSYYDSEDEDEDEGIEGTETVAG